MRNFILKAILGMVFALVTCTVNAQNVTVAGSTGADGSYATLKAAFDAINGNPAQAGNNITITITGGTTETAIAALNQPATSSWASLTISPSGGMVHTITGNLATELVALNGADNVTIDGLNSGGNGLIISNTNTSATSGTSTLRLYNDAQNNLITRCSVLGSATMAVGTNGGNIFIHTANSTAGFQSGNDNNTISFCIIGPAGSNLPTKGIFANGSTTAAGYYNSNNTFTNNNIFDYFGAAVQSAGIYVGSGNTDVTITNNKLYQTAARTQTTGAIHAGIQLASTNINNTSISGNTVGFANASGTGTYTFNGASSSSRFYPIYASSLGTTTLSTISNNTVSGITMGGAISGTTSSGPFIGIYTVGLANVTGNTIGSTTVANSVTLSSSSTSQSDITGIYNNGSSVTDLSSNSIGNITTSNSSTGGILFRGIYSNTGSAVGATINNNNVGGNSSTSWPISVSAAATTTRGIGIQNGLPFAIINNNIVRNITCNSTNTGTAASAAVIGILNSNTSTTVPGNTVISNNQVFNLSNTTNTATAVHVYGLYNTGSVTVNANVHEVYKNFIHTLTNASTSPTASIRGMHVASGRMNYYNNRVSVGTTTTEGIEIYGMYDVGTTSLNNYYFNTVYVGGSGITGGSTATYAFRTDGLTNTRDYRNNIFYNARSNGAGTGVHYGIRLGGTGANPAGLTTNHNCIRADGSGGIFGFYDAADRSFATWKTATGQDANSTNADPLLNTTTLAVNAGVTPTSLESGGTAITGITTDYENDTRPGPAGSTNGGATAPDMGADEFDGVPAVPMVYASSTTEQVTGFAYAGNTNQSIIRIKIVTTGSTTPLVLTSLTLNANGTTNIADIDATTAKVYYTGASTAFGTGSLFGATTPTVANFVVNGSQALSEGDNYFWLAYDVIAGATSGNLIDGECIDINVGTTETPTVTNPAGSKTILAAMSGPYNIGASQTFPNFANLTDALVDLNARGVSGAVTFLLQNDYSSAGETFPLTINQVTGASGTNTITIRPAAGVTATISGLSASSIFKLNGADFIIIDGSNSGGTDKSLTIANTNTATATAAIWVSSLGAGLGATNNTIKNCIVESGTIASTTYGIYVAGNAISTTGTGEDNHNLTVQNNTIRKATYGIFARGVATTGELTGLNITQNTIGSNNAAEYITDYGMQVYSAIAPSITQNEIFNLIANNSKYGISMGTNISNAIISRNNIHGFGYTNTTAYITYGIYFLSSTACTNNQLDNNIIYDLRSYGSTTNTTAPIGIRIVGGDGYRIYFNTVSLTDAIGSATAGVFSHGLMVSTASTNMDIRNNIFYNARTGGTTPRNYSIYTITATTFTNINYNNYFSNGAALGFIGAEVANLAALQAATTQDANSIATDPVLNSPTNMLPSAGSPVVGAGDNATGITIDYPGTTRNDPPTIGAYENAADVTGPIIGYSNLGNTLCATDRDLSPVTITDPGSGVNTTAGTRPRLYYKKSTNANTFVDNTNATDGWKYVEATGAGGSPFSFTTNYALVNGGVSAGDSLSYFVVAQDLATPVNVGINSGTFASAPASVALTAGAFPVTGTVNGYRILTGGLAGSVNVGPGETYTTLSGAGGLFSAINAAGLTGNLTANITGNISTEDGTNALNAINYGCAGSYTLTIKPAATVTATVSGSSAAALIKLNGADNVIIDGSNNGSSSRDLTIDNSSTATNTAVIWVSSLGAGAGATDNTIRNCILLAGSRTVTSTFGIFAGGTSISTTGGGESNNNLTIQNNSIGRAYYGLYSNGVAVTGVTANLQIIGNHIGSNNAADYIGNRGIRIGNAQNVNIEGNTVFNFNNSSTTIQTTGIEIAANTTNAAISKNLIYGLEYTGTSNRAGQGISISTVAAANLTVTNNVVHTLKGHSSVTATNNSWGILVLAGGGIDINFNSISQTTSFGGTATNVHGGIYLASGLTDLRIRNNAIANTSATGLLFNIYSLSTNTAFTEINYNDYYVTGSNHTGFLGGNQTSLANWQSATGQDANSISVNPMYNSATNLQPQLGSPLVGAGLSGTPVSTDILGTTRNSPPTIGAYELAADLAAPAIVYTTLGNTNLLTNRVLTGFAAITDPSGVNTTAGTKPRIYYKRSTDADTYVDNTSGSNGWKFAEASNSSTPFDFTIDYALLSGGTGVSIGNTIQYFVVAQDLAATPNVGINSGTFAVQPASVGLTAAAFPMGGTVNSYLITPSISGTITVPGTYPSLTLAGGAFEAINNSTLTGNLNIEITGDLTVETGAVALNAFAAPYTVTINPAGGAARTISGTSGASASALIKLNGADRVTIDGLNIGGNSLTINNTSATSGTAAIWLSSLGVNEGCTNNIIANTTIHGSINQNTGTGVTFGILLTGSTISATIASNTAGNDNDNNTIYDNVFHTLRYGIYTRGGSSTNPNTGNVIAGNTIGAASFGATEIGKCGILVREETGMTIINNEIRFIGGDFANTSGGSDRAGIAIGTDAAVPPVSVFFTAGNISRNKIHDIVDERTFSATAIAVAAADGTNNTDNTFSNNVIYNVLANGTISDYPSGIVVSASRADKFVFNSIYLAGDNDPNASATAPTVHGGGGVVITSTNVVNPVLNNNIISVDLSSSSTATLRYCAINIPTGYSLGTGSSNYNDLFVNSGNPQMFTGLVGISTTAPTGYATLSAWQGFSAQDANSYSVNPGFTSGVDLTPIANIFPSNFLLGTNITGVTTDINGTTRSNPPDIGAYEGEDANRWIGATSSAWSTGTNWDNGIVPAANQSITIAENNLNNPVLAADVTVNSLAINGMNSTMGIASNTLTVNGVVSGTGKFSGTSGSNLNINGAAGTLNFTTGSSSLNNLSLGAAGSATLGTALHVFGTIGFTAGASLNMNAQSVTLKSNATNTARIADLTGSTLTGATNVTVERFIPQRNGVANGGRAYRLLTSTVNTATSIGASWMEGGLVTTVGGSSDPNPGFGTHITGAGGNTNGFDVTQSNQSSMYTAANGVVANFTPVPNTNGTLNSLTGYYLYIRGDRSVSLQVPLSTNMPTTATTLRATGTVNTGTITSFTNPFVGAGALNLITNPYPSPINWSLVKAASSNITDYYSFWDPNIGTRGGFVAVSTAGIATAGTANQYIQSGQAFYVESDGAVPAVSIQETHKAAVNNNTVFIVPPAPIEAFRTGLFFVEDSGYRRQADGVLVMYGNSYHAAVDAQDAKEINNWDENIAVRRSATNLAIESRPVVTVRDTIPLFMNNMKQQTYEFEFIPTLFTNIGLKAELIDNYLNSRTTLSVVDTIRTFFTVTADPGSSASDRFMVVFGPQTPLAIDVTTIRAQAKYQPAAQGGTGVQVDWSAKTEQDMDRYELERSFNGSSFTRIHTTTAIGNSSIPVTYGWLDANPQYGVNFYRIKAIDKAGLVKYTTVVKVNFGKANPAISVYPNPVNGNSFTLQLTDLEKGSYQFVLFNSAGQAVYKGQVQHNGGSVNIPVTPGVALPRGTYQLRVTGANDVQFSKSIIKN